MKPRFLFILYFFPPAPGTAPKRNANIAKSISALTEKSLVFTAPYPGKQAAEFDEMEVQVMPVLDYRFWLRSKTKDGYLPEHKKRQRWKQWGIKLINSFPVNIIVGEGGIIYFFNLLLKGNKAIRQHNITHIYSSFRPFADHYAAYVLKRKHPHVKWIADFRDLIIDDNYRHILLPFLHQPYFKKIFSRADLLTTVSDGLAKHLKEYNTEVITLRNGITSLSDKALEPVHCKYFRIAYTGSLFLDTRNAVPLFKAVKELIMEGLIGEDEIKIIYAGKDGQYWNNMAKPFELDAILLNKGIITHDEAVHIQQNACINLLLTISTEELQGVLTGKMIEYFAAGAPVLAIVVNQNDQELSRILEEVEIGKSFSDQEKDHMGIKNFIFSEFLNWKKNGTNRKPVNTHVLRNKYSIEQTMQPLFEWISSHSSSA